MHRLVTTLVVLLAGVAFAQDASELFRDTILPSFLAAVATVAGGFVTWAAARFSAWLKVRAKETQNAMLRTVLVTVADRAGVAVNHVAQTAVDKLKAASADGKLSPQDAATALKAAVLETWSSLGKNARDFLLGEYGSFDAVVKQVIEPTVEAKVKEAKAIPSTETPVTGDAAMHELRLAQQKLQAMVGNL
jgi:hypothetical protein